MGNCGGQQKDLPIEKFMKCLMDQMEMSSILSQSKIQSQHQSKLQDYHCQDIKTKTKISKQILEKAIELGNSSNLRVYEAKQEIYQNRKKIENEKNYNHEEIDRVNPYDINLMNRKESIIFTLSCFKFNFNQYIPYHPKHVIITKNAIRIYPSKKDALNLYGKPEIAIPLSAVESIKRTVFDWNDDKRMESVSEQVKNLNKNMFEFVLKDDFLPLYTNEQYLKVINNTSLAMEMSPNKRNSDVSKMNSSPGRLSISRNLGSNLQKQGALNSSTYSRQSVSQPYGQHLDIHKKTGIELRDSPSKSTKFSMRYINTYQDVGPQIANPKVTHENLKEMAKNLDKREVWIKSDLRLIFARLYYKISPQGNKVAITFINFILEPWKELYATKTPGGAQSSVFMTEISTTIGPSSVKKAPSTLRKTMHTNSSKQGLPTLINNYNSTANLQKNLVFPNIKKSVSLLNLRAQSQQSSKKSRAVDLQKIIRLAEPRQYLSTQPIDIKKEKGDFVQEIITRKEDAAEFINNIYKASDQGTITEYVNFIESLQFVKDKIEQFKIQLQQKIKEYNEVTFQKKDLQNMLDELRKQLSMIELQNSNNVDTIDKIQQLIQDSLDCQQKLDMELLHTEQLNHIISRDKLLILDMKQPIDTKKQDMQHILNSIISIKALKNKMQKEITRFEKFKKLQLDDADNKKKIADNMKEMFLQDISQKTMFDEVYKNQIKIIEDKEKEMKLKKIEDQNQKQLEHQEKLLAEEKKRGETDKKKIKFQEDFLKLSEECNVNKIQDLVLYQNDQSEQKKDLKEIAQQAQKLTEEKQAKLKDLQQQLQKLKFQADETKLAEQQKQAEDQQARRRLLQDAETQQHHHEPEKLREEYTVKMKKMKEVVATAIMSIARVAHQLKEDPKVTPMNADQKLSVCGLRLEHMVATLYKKKPTFNIESVNTDYSSDLPPFFLGIKNAIYINPPIIENDNENELEKLYNINDIPKEKDEENDFLNDEYSKYKRLTKALAQKQKDDGLPMFMSLNEGKGSDNKNQLSKTLGQILKDKVYIQKNKSDFKEQQQEQQSQNNGNIQSKQDKFDIVMNVLNKGKIKPSPSQQVLLLTEKDKEEIETKKQIQKQLSKIVHRTWYIFDPEKQGRAKDTFKKGQLNIVKPLATQNTSL
eukprot:403331322